MSQCEGLHGLVQTLPLVRYPFELERLPRNGIYFFFEEGEVCGHSGSAPRIVRVGTHRQDNFRSRISDHYLMRRRPPPIGDPDRPCPKDRSIFRKNLGRAILNRDRDPYLEVWERDFTSRAAREEIRGRRSPETEVRVESEVTQLLRERFSFRFLAVEQERDRLGGEGLERALIGTLARCGACRGSDGWLGRHSPKDCIRESGLWLTQHLKDEPLTPAQEDLLTRLASATLSRYGPGR